MQSAHDKGLVKGGPALSLWPEQLEISLLLKLLLLHLLSPPPRGRRRRDRCNLRTSGCNTANKRHIPLFRCQPNSDISDPPPPLPPPFPCGRCNLRTKVVSSEAGLPYHSGLTPILSQWPHTKRPVLSLWPHTNGSNRSNISYVSNGSDSSNASDN